MNSGHTSPVLGLKTSSLAVSQMPETERLVVVTAMKELLTESFFSICKLKKIADLIGTPTHGRAWDLLSALHCTNYADMPLQLRESIPHLINECLTTKPKVIEDVSIALEGVIP
jgi:hypothetical protein